MSSEEWQRIKDVFTEALKLEGAARDQFLRDACKNEREIEEQVLRLLSSFQPSFLESPAVEQVAELIVEPRHELEPGESVGGYRIKRRLGSGGQGTVYLAHDPHLSRDVAIKLLPFGDGIENIEFKRMKREAQAAGSLSHPNICAVHNLESSDDFSFIVMQFIEGETLAEILARGPLAQETAIHIAIQLADALAAAHAVGIVHRDVKPSNVIISNGWRATILDFGLAKLTAIHSGNSSLSIPGAIMGTVGYMSPEQTKGISLDGRSDVWSLAVSTVEMLTGRNPFHHGNTAETFAAILVDEPDLSELPEKIRPVLKAGLEKEQHRRTRSAAEFRDQLIALRDDQAIEEHLRSRRFNIRAKARGFRSYAGMILLVAITSVAVFFLYKAYRYNRALSELNTIRTLVASKKTFEAYDLAREIRPYLEETAELDAMTNAFTDRLNVKSDPPGALVHIRRFQAYGNHNGDREFVGKTPLNDVEVPRGLFQLFVELDGYEPLIRTISGLTPDYQSDVIAQPPMSVNAKLVNASLVPRNMVYVPGGNYRLVAYARPTEEATLIGDFFIDRYEVSNLEFREFVSAGGYTKPEYWNELLEFGGGYDFGRAMAQFVDQTGLPGPRKWINQDFPKGDDLKPVTGVSWFEAAAYARFRGKMLPSIFQWEKAARDGEFDQGRDTMPWGPIRYSDSTDGLANFGNNGPMDTRLNEFGASPFGCLNMAGNAAEWLLNSRASKVLVAGGSWGDKPYLFGYYADFPAGYASDRIGFRLVQPIDHTDAGGFEFLPIANPQYEATSARRFNAWKAHYAYDDIPIDARIEETVESDSWIRETISFNANRTERTVGYLYIPKYAKLPLHVVHWIPAADVPLGFSSLKHSIESVLSPVIKSGRAVFAVELMGYPGQPPKPDGDGKIAFRKEMVRNVTYWRRGLDYLYSRNEVDQGSIAFVGLSWGGNAGLILTAIENRYKSAAFVGVGVRPSWSNWLEEASPINFVPHIRIPKLVLKGRYDEAHPLSTETEPLFRIMTGQKRLLILESGHLPPPELLAPALNSWLTETLPQ